MQAGLGSAFPSLFIKEQAFLEVPMVQDASLHESKPLLPNEPFIDPHCVVPFLIGATVGEIERELILQTLACCEGNRTHAARVLGVSVRTLRNKIREYAAHGADVPAHH